MISIIVPVLNEAARVASLVSQLGNNLSGLYRAELIFIDGGSTDDTITIIQQLSRVTKDFVSIKLISSEKGRAKQMNKGAAIASGEILYFLHADCFPPQDFDKYIVSEVRMGNSAGCFRMQFDNGHWWLRLAGWLTRFSWRVCRGGDQSQFITQRLFNEIGGFDERYAIYEDNILINELYRRKKFVVIQKPLITSARLYEQVGVWNLQYHFWAIYIKRWLGADADNIYDYYQKHIKTACLKRNSTSF